LDLMMTELLCARLCHDMAGAVGAAAAGAELLEDGFDAETAGLVSASAAGAVARLKFFRAALGPAGPVQAADSVRDLAAAYLRASASGGMGSLLLRWDCVPASLDGESARLLLNLILLARDALPRGGEVTVEVGAESLDRGMPLAVGFAGEGAGLSDEVVGLLLGLASAPSSPRAAQAWFARAIAGKTGGNPRVEQLPRGGRITV
jgi:histidine phosphotransferase ChpT